jgi:hypothetical protein
VTPRTGSAHIRMQATLRRLQHILYDHTWQHIPHPNSPRHPTRRHPIPLPLHHLHETLATMARRREQGISPFLPTPQTNSLHHHIRRPRICRCHQHHGGIHPKPKISTEKNSTYSFNIPAYNSKPPNAKPLEPCRPWATLSHTKTNTCYKTKFSPSPSSMDPISNTSPLTNHIKCSGYTSTQL